MEEIRILSPTGVCGSGFLETSFETALTRRRGAVYRFNVNHVVEPDEPEHGGQQYAPLMDIEIP